MKILIVFLARFLIYFYFLAIPFFWFLGQKKLAINIVLSAAIVRIIKFILDFFYYTPRPFINNPSLLLDPSLKPWLIDSSFFSSHAAVSFAIAATIFIAHKQLGAVFLFGAALISFSRVSAGVHYPLDVLAGALFGITTALIINRLINP